MNCPCLRNLLAFARDSTDKAVNGILCSCFARLIFGCTNCLIDTLRLGIGPYPCENSICIRPQGDLCCGNCGCHSHTLLYNLLARLFGPRRNHHRSPSLAFSGRNFFFFTLMSLVDDNFSHSNLCQKILYISTLLEKTLYGLSLL